MHMLMMTRCKIFCFSCAYISAVLAAWQVDTVTVKFVFPFQRSSSYASVLWMQAETEQGPMVGHSREGDTGASSGLSPSAIEGMLLMAVEKLYKEDRELDVQMGLLRLVLQVLQRHGEPPHPIRHHGSSLLWWKLAEKRIYLLLRSAL